MLKFGLYRVTPKRKPRVLWWTEAIDVEDFWDKWMAQPLGTGGMVFAVLSVLIRKDGVSTHPGFVVAPLERAS